MKKSLVIGVVVFVLVLGILVMKSNKTNKNSILPAPSQEFQRWEKQWEKQRF